MTNDKQPLDKNEQKGTPQHAQGGEAKTNPFKDTAEDQLPDQPMEEETDLEQQRKEAMTERD